MHFASCNKVLATAMVGHEMLSEAFIQRQNDIKMRGKAAYPTVPRIVSEMRRFG
jgi:hypothetical protein